MKPTNEALAEFAKTAVAFLEEPSQSKDSSSGENESSDDEEGGADEDSDDDDEEYEDGGDSDSSSEEVKKPNSRDHSPKRSGDGTPISLPVPKE